MVFSCRKVKFVQSITEDDEQMTCSSDLPLLALKNNNFHFKT